MKTTRVVLTALLLGLSASVVALPTFVKEFKDNYKVAKQSKLAQLDCAVCHVGKSPKLNPYGLDLKKVIAEAKTKKLTPVVLKKVEVIDSDKDGTNNLSEIKADTNPGDPKSKP
ncbi:MAG TPA: hypothetical protein VNJ09_09600 [Chthonomonadales bacterium]|nr:hypothetical protein [Chthonomonadales bacterium]